MNLLASFHVASGNAWSTSSLTTGLPLCWLLGTLSGVKEQVSNIWKLFYLCARVLGWVVLIFLEHMFLQPGEPCLKRLKEDFRRDRECH